MLTWTSVGHGQETRLGVLELEVLIGKLGTVDGLSTSTVASSKVTTLEHKVRNDSMKRATFVTESVLTSAELSEVLGRLGNYIIVELEDDLAHGATVLGNVEEYVGHGGSSRCKGSDKGWCKGHRKKERRATEKSVSTSDEGERDSGEAALVNCTHKKEVLVVMVW